LIKKIYNLIKNKLEEKNLIKYNLKILSKLNIKKNFIENELKKLDLDFDNKTLSWHYHLFAGLKKKFILKKIKILEIGTHNGQFANFLSLIYPEAKIYTIDLPSNDSKFINSYNREKKNYRLKFLRERKTNLDRKNIIFMEMDSSNLLNTFPAKSFDLIWVDGDHLNPQVTMDLMSSIQLLKKNGILLCDDIIRNSNISSNLVDTSSYEALQFLNKTKILENHYIFKRISQKKKFISFSYLKFL